MGLIRVLLALSVVSGHFISHPFLKLVGGEIAVQSFFMISGFYIAMIFPKHYESVGSFWQSRFVRLYPTYLVCGLFALRHPVESLQNLLALPTEGALFIFFTNATILFQDLTMFLEVADNSVQFTANFMASEKPLMDYLILVQAWSLGLEMSFYLLAPYAVVSAGRMVLLLAASILIRVILVQQGYTHDPWSYRFFPTELAFFIIGALSYRASQHLPIQSIVQHLRPLAWMLWCACVVMICIFPFIELPEVQKRLAFYALLAISIPAIFSISKNMNMDNLMGNLSYPVYCCHLIVIRWVSKLPFWKPYLKGTLPGALLAMALVILVAYFLYKKIELPVDRYRRRYRKAALPST